MKVPLRTVIFILVTLAHLVFYVLLFVRPSPLQAPKPRHPIHVMTFTAQEKSHLSGSPSPSIAKHASMAKKPVSKNQKKNVTVAQKKEVDKKTVKNKTNAVRPEAKKTVKNSPKKVIKETSPKIPQSDKSQDLFNELNAALAKFEGKNMETKSKSNLPIPKGPTALNIDHLEKNTFSEVDFGDHSKENYQNLLIQFFQEKLKLPEFGDVKILLILDEKGKIKELKVLQSNSEKNRIYIENHLEKLNLPQVPENLLSKKPISFLIVFCNE